MDKKLTKYGQTIRTSISKLPAKYGPGYRVILYVAGCNILERSIRSMSRDRAVKIAARMETDASSAQVFAGGCYVRWVK